MNDLFKPKRVYMKISETAQRKGIETYCDEDSLRNFNSIYKGQLISALKTALELLVGEPIMIMTEKDYETEQRQSPEPKLKNERTRDSNREKN